MLALVIRAKVGWRLLSTSKSHTARGLSAVSAVYTFALSLTGMNYARP